jgi:hypothetical protein
MTWKRRILLYFFGFGLGVLILWIAYGDRILDGWTPASRVRSLITNAKQFDADSTAVCKLRCAGVSLDGLRNAVKEAKVDLSRSQTSKEPCHEYYLNCTVGGKAVDAYFATCLKDSTVRLLQVYADGNCDCK